MASTGGDSPRPFDASDSQANMDWLDHRGDHAQSPANDHAVDSPNPVIEEDEKVMENLDDHHVVTRDDVNSDGQVLSAIKIEKDDDGTEGKATGVTTFDLTLEENAKQELWKVPVKWKETIPDQIEILDSDEDDVIKQEFPRWQEVFPGYIEISDSEDDHDQFIKQELPGDIFFDWKEMPSYIDISDSDHDDEVTEDLGLAGAQIRESSQPQLSEEILATDHGNQEQTIISSDMTVEDGQADGSQNTVQPIGAKINLGSSVLRTSKAKRSAANTAKMKELQAIYRAKALALALSRSKGTDANPTTLNANLVENGSYPNRNIENRQAGTPFHGNDELDEDSLFLPEGNSSTSRKRPLAATVETEKDDSDVQEVDGSTVVSTRGKPKRKRPQNKPAALSPEELRQIEENEASASLATALQQFTANLPKSRPVNSKINADISSRSANKKGKKKDTSSTRVEKTKHSKKRHKKLDPRAAAFVSGLQPHDVLAEANANLGRDELPTLNESNKQKYLKALLHSVPKDDRPGVRGEKARLHRAALNFGHGAVTPTDLGWRIKGMKSQLLHHQLLGASFMRTRELGREQPFGGLLADEMGFGKTVMMIVTMVTNPPQAGERHKSTLIVCSPALLLQWKRELLTHASEHVFQRILIYSRGSKIEGEGCAAVLEEADVVLTTYGQVIKSYPLEAPPEHLETAQEKRDWAEKHWSDKCGLLHQAHFHRVVLDEAQSIKNHKAHTSLACQAIRARYRWAISGTPIMNRLEELYPYFKFLRVQYTGSFDDFRKNFCGRGDPLYTDRLHACLQAFMLRRTHKDLIFGKPIIKLPECHPKTINLRPTKIEIAIYRAIEMRYTQAVNVMSQKLSDENLRRLIMAMVTRLRQMTAHLFLVQHVMQDMFEMEDMKQLWNLVKDEPASRDALVAMTALIDNKEDDEQLESEPPPTVSNDDHPEPSEGLLRRFQKYLRSLFTNLETTEYSKRSTCSRCGAPPEDPYLTSCMHVYCHECILVVANQAAETNEEGARCLECNTVYTSTMPCVGVKELNYDMGTGFGNDDTGPKRKRHRPPKDLLKWIRKTEGGTLPSTKSTAVMEQIEEWLTKEPDKKIIVFSQWHMMMQIVVQDCIAHKWGYCTYHGAMTNKQRDKAIEEFGSKPEIKIMVASLKCGGLGLNLTMASKIICIDLWFNSYIEQQAFCRIFRIGQESETYINRYVLKGTVDERLIALQERKKKLIGRALGDTEAFKHFTAEDLMRLFGTVRYDANSRPFIVVEDEDDQEKAAEEAVEEVEEVEVATSTTL